MTLQYHTFWSSSSGSHCVTQRLCGRAVGVVVRYCLLIKNYLRVIRTAHVFTYPMPKQAAHLLMCWCVNQWVNLLCADLLGAEGASGCG